MNEVLWGLALAAASFSLTPLGAAYAKRRGASINRSLAVFIAIMVVRLGVALEGAVIVQKSGGNVFAFLLTFATAFSLLLIPEVMLIVRLTR